MRFTLAVICATLAGCANPVVYRDRAIAATPAQLCEVFFYGSGMAQRAANEEREYRMLDCNQYRQEAAVLYQAHTQRAIANDAATNALVQQLLAPAPMIAPPAIAPTVNCQTYRLGSTLQTNCH